MNYVCVCGGGGGFSGRAPDLGGLCRNIELPY